MRKIVFTCFLFLLISKICLGLTNNIQINADVFELDGKQNFVFASGNVVVTQTDVKIYGQQAKYNQKQDVVQIYNKVRVEKGKLIMICDSVEADGKDEVINAFNNIDFQSIDIKGKSNRARYDLKKQEIILWENPVAWRDQDQLSGDTIIINLKTSKILTKGQAKVILKEAHLKK